MAKPRNRNVVVFDTNLRLIGMFSSYYTAAKATGISHQLIIKACKGDIVAANQMYWRDIDIAEFFMDCDDLGQLTLLEFDAKQGKDRKIYATRNMRKNEIILESQYKPNSKTYKK